MTPRLWICVCAIAATLVVTRSAFAQKPLGACMASNPNPANFDPSKCSMSQPGKTWGNDPRCNVPTSAPAVNCTTQGNLSPAYCSCINDPTGWANACCPPGTIAATQQILDAMGLNICAEWDVGAIFSKPSCKRWVSQKQCTATAQRCVNINVAAQQYIDSHQPRLAGMDFWWIFLMRQLGPKGPGVLACYAAVDDACVKAEGIAGVTTMAEFFAGGYTMGVTLKNCLEAGYSACLGITGTISVN